MAAATKIFTKKWITLAAGAVFLVLVLLLLAGRDQIPQARAVRVVRQDLAATISSNGKVEPIEPFVLRAQFPTFVERVYATEGQTVKLGEPILMLDSADVRAQLAQARADLVSAEQDLRSATAGGPPDQLTQLSGDIRKAEIDVQNYERMQDSLQQLVKQHAATQDELALNQAALSRAQATVATLQRRKGDVAARAGTDAQRGELRVQQSRALIASLEEKVQSTVVNSPVTGTLYSLPVHLHDYVLVGEILAQAADLRRIRVRAFVDEPDLGWLAAGQSVEITWDAMPGHVWKGVTEQTPREVVAHGNRSVGEVLCTVDNSKLELIPNVNVNVRIVVRQSSNALVAPRSAVRTINGKHLVYVVADGKLHPRDIQVGISDATHYEVLSGLQEGDEVILPGDLAIRDGMSVRVTEAQLPE
jgi:HlyD family secretion protein